jgi:putative ABC transport system substrate-binding protein
VRLSAKRLSKVVACAATLAASISAITGCPCWDETGIIVIPDSFAVVHSDHILRLVEHHRLPAIYPFRLFALKGGLLTYGLDIPAIYRQAAEYADRILRGANPSDLPVQAPNKFELIVNLKTATALGLEVNVTVEYHWLEGRYDRLPALVAD